MTWNPSQDAAQNARTKLPKRVEKYFKAGREVVRGKNTPKELHRFRVATKRFRYTLELFRPVYGPSLDRQLSALRNLQDVLGQLSDHHTIQTLTIGDKPLQAMLDSASEGHLERFHRAWKEFDSDGRLQRWKAYFAGGRPRASG